MSSNATCLKIIVQHYNKTGKPASLVVARQIATRIIAGYTPAV